MTKLDKFHGIHFEPGKTNLKINLEHIKMDLLNRCNAHTSTVVSGYQLRFKYSEINFI